MGSPLNTTSPLVGGSSPEISLSSVDLPQPDGPTIDRKLPFSMLQDRFWNTVRALPFTKKTLLSPFTSMIGLPAAVPDTTVSFGLPALLIRDPWRRGCARRTTPRSGQINPSA